MWLQWSIDYGLYTLLEVMTFVSVPNCEIGISVESPEPRLPSFQEDPWMRRPMTYHE
jgi:hypothetical protein